jgi:hypothetical protein
MKNYTKATKMIERTIEELSSLICDGCEKPITGKRINDHTIEGVPYFNVTTGHHDWGMSSSETREEHQFCSMDCVTKHQWRYFAKATGSEYYEIEREYCKLEPIKESEESTNESN